MSKLSRLMRNLTFWVIVFGVLGYVSAMIWGDPTWAKTSTPPEFYNFIGFLKTGFLYLLKMLIAPMIFFSLLGGLLNIGDKSQLKNLGSSAIIYYLSTTVIAIVIGLIAVFFIHPWKKYGATLKGKQKTSIAKHHDGYQKPKKLISANGDSIVLILKNIFEKAFENPIKAISENNVLGIATSAFLIGLALILYLPGGGIIGELVTEINIVIGKILGWVIKTTPLGVFAIAFDFQLKAGGAVVGQLISFALLVVGATLFHGLVILPLIAWIFAGVSPIKLISRGSKPLLVALSTSSSSATLPVTMQTCEEEFGVTKGVSGFVFPLGATMNMDGTALFEGIAAVFLAFLFGIELSSASIVIIFFMSMISSIGAPGMPSGSMAGMQIVLLSAGIPLEAIGVLLIVEKPLDTIRTAVNVEGDMIGALVVQSRMNKKLL